MPLFTMRFFLISLALLGCSSTRADVIDDMAPRLDAVRAELATMVSAARALQDTPLGAERTPTDAVYRSGDDAHNNLEFLPLGVLNTPCESVTSDLFFSGSLTTSLCWAARSTHDDVVAGEGFAASLAAPLETVGYVVLWAWADRRDVELTDDGTVAQMPSGSIRAHLFARSDPTTPLMSWTTSVTYAEPLSPLDIYTRRGTLAERYDHLLRRDVRRALVAELAARLPESEIVPPGDDTTVRELLAAAGCRE